jgi:NADPH-dependent 2,4-dienoyl-CoA reductase/sulfur reductase-like enzyme/bacterioferritin-associated ferredoxin
MAATDVAVVGAGPAGLAAAVAAAGCGLRVTLIDELPAPGGQYLIDHAAMNGRTASGGWATAAERHGTELLSRLSQTDLIETRFQTLVWNLTGDLTLALYQQGQAEYLSAGAVILASGAREQVIPFPGWTLPGVMTVGAAQLLAKRHRIAPGRRILLAGSGPLLLPAAAHLAELGAQISAVLEATRLQAWLKHGPSVWGQWDRLNEGRSYLSALRRARIPYRFGRTVVRAQGAGRIETAVAAELDSRGRPVSGTEEELHVDALCVGFGLVPNSELAQAAGASLRFDPAGGGWTPEASARLETSVPGLFTAGEAAGIAGAAAALLDGRLAGLGAAYRLGCLSESKLSEEWASCAGQRRRMKRFGAMLNTLFAPAQGLSAITTDETVICRCEEVTAGEVRAAVAHGVTTLDALKTRIRTGQGHCQGRTCGATLARMIAQQSGRPAAEAGVFRARPPVKPVPMAALAGIRTETAGGMEP